MLSAVLHTVLITIVALSALLSFSIICCTEKSTYFGASNFILRFCFTGTLCKPEKKDMFVVNIQLNKVDFEF